MDDLHHRIDERHHQQVLGREHAVHQVAGQLVPVPAHQHQRGNDDRQPQERAGPSEQRPQPRHRARQEGVGIDQRNAQRHRALEILQPQLAALLLLPLEQFGGVGRDVGRKQVGAVELAERRDHVILRGRVLAELVDDPFPQLLDRVRAVEPADQQIGAAREAVDAARRPVVEHEPHRAAITVATNADVAAQARLEPGDVEPGRGVERIGHTRDLKVLCSG